MSRITTYLLAVTALTTVAPTQQGPSAQVSKAADWRIPIHTACADPIGGEYGIWACGPGYKVSFHEGFTFYPLLGRAYSHNLPLRLTEASLSVAGVPMAAPETVIEEHHSDWRYELCRPGWTEVYDVLPGGVEQSFVLRELPASSGDLVIALTFDTELCAEPQPPVHGPVLFADDEGRALVSYGAAFAFDAVGRTIEVATSVDGQRIRLHVDGAWLAAATLPVTVDPLTATVNLVGEFSPYGQVLSTDTVTSYDIPGARRVCVVHSREFSASDVDAFGFVAEWDLSSVRRFWSDVQTSWKSLRPRCTFSDREDDWVIAVEREFTSGGSAVRLYHHSRSNTTTNGGKWYYLQPPSGTSQSVPDVGGQHDKALSQVLVVYEQGPTAGGRSEVYGVIFTPNFGTLSAPFRIAGTSIGPYLDRRHPSVGTCTRDQAWLVAWDEYNSYIYNDDWDVYVNLVFSSTRQDTPQVVGPATSSSLDKISPMIDGDNGQYLVAYTVAGSTFLDRSLGYQRIDWSWGHGPPTLGTRRTLSSTALMSPPTLHGLAYDSNTSSHWAMIYEKGTGIYCKRVGHTGGVTESVTVHTYASGVGAASVAYLSDAGHKPPGFLLIWSDNNFLFPVYGRYLRYPGASTTVIGNSCGNGALSAPWTWGLPYAGNGNYRLEIDKVIANAPAIFFAGPLPGTAPIPGAPGCMLYLDPATMFVALSTAANSQGFAHMKLPLPDDPVFVGNIYFQGAHLAPSANPLGLLTTNSLFVKVR